ncbi:hypothetical protein [uncultured Polaribacter sp.]|uniref:hypothetical protein n=1 Tax=uncultured Polaribacter sp. TaxID=174711 RepID=UPI00262FEFED|nr:hypothetical protein [uncultured Polaribacter sp.]
MKNNKPLSKFILFLTVLSVLNSCVSNKKEGNSSLNERAIPFKIKESDFYEVPKAFKITKIFKALDNDFNTNDSQELQKAINDLHKLGGGKLIIPKGNYTFSEISLKSNIHLSINSETVIRPYENSENDNYAVFKITNNFSFEPIENTSIVGNDGQFTIDLRHLKNKNLRVIQTWNAKNFVYSNILIEDNYSRFSALEFNAVEINDKIYGSKNGVVKNIKVKNAHYGFGVVQLQYGNKILFKNLLSYTFSFCFINF